MLQKRQRLKHWRRASAPTTHTVNNRSFMSYHQSPLLLRASTRNTRAHTRHTTHTDPYLKGHAHAWLLHMYQLKPRTKPTNKKHTRQSESCISPSFLSRTPPVLSANHTCPLTTVKLFGAFACPPTLVTTRCCASTRGGADDHAKEHGTRRHTRTQHRGVPLVFRPVIARPSFISATRSSAVDAKEKETNHILTHTPRLGRLFIGQPVTSAVDANQKNTHRRLTFFTLASR